MTTALGHPRTLQPNAFWGYVAVHACTNRDAMCNVIGSRLCPVRIGKDEGKPSLTESYLSICLYNYLSPSTCISRSTSMDLPYRQVATSAQNNSAPGPFLYLHQCKCGMCPGCRMCPGYYSSMNRIHSRQRDLNVGWMDSTEPVAVFQVTEINRNYLCAYTD